MQWHVLPLEAAVARLRDELGARAPRSDQHLRQFLERSVIPITLGGVVSLGPHRRTREEVQTLWQNKCRCSGQGMGSDDWLCAQCGGARTPLARPGSAET